MRIRSLLVGIALLVTGTAIGATNGHFASADISSGDRSVLVSIAPCRLADTRPAPDNVGPRASPLGAGDTHEVDAQEAGTPCEGRIPADASALSLNITALGATTLSFLTIWAGGDRPLAASLNPAPGQPPVPNAVTTELSVDQEFLIYNESGSVNVVVDVNGYYVGHDHDDRYYTEGEADDRFLTEAESDDRYYTEGEADARFVKVPTTVVVTSPEFIARESAAVYTNGGVLVNQSGVLRCFTAPLHLPEGRTITNIEATVTSNSGGGTDFFLSLQRIGVTTGLTSGEASEPDMATANQTVSTPSVLATFGSDTIVDPVVRNDTHVYDVELCLPDKGGLWRVVISLE